MSSQWYRALDKNGRRAFWTSFAGFSLDAMDVQLYAFALPVLLGLWSLTDAEAGLLATVTLTSSALGGWIAGLLSDRLGRIRVLTVTILWLALATCLCGLAQTFDQLLVARALQGLGFGGEWAVGAVFVAEVAAPATRGRMVGMVQSAWAVGWGLAAAVSAVALSVLPPGLGWRVAFIVGLVPAIVLFLVRTRMKDSPVVQTARRRPSWRAIFAGPLLGATVRGSLLAAGMHGGYWAIATWWPQMLHAERRLSSAATSGYFAVIVAGSFLGYAVGAWISDAVGRRVTLASFALGGVLVVQACTALPVSNLTLLLLGFPLGFFALGMFSAIGPVLTELYPTEVRGSGLGFCYNFGRGLAGAAPVLIGLSIERVGVAHAIEWYATAAYAVVLLAAALLRETKGQVLKGLAEFEPQT